MKKLTLFCGVFLLPFLSLAQNTGQKEKTTISKLDSVVVEAWRAGKNTPVSYSRMESKEIRQVSPSQSLPMVLSLMPSVVTSTEGGNGLGYTSMRIRGSEGSRINVTVNGIALNDAESQEVFWVNIPSFAGFLQDIQVQRGVGTSTNGSGAFGASINLRTLFAQPEAYGIAESGVASYKSYMTMIGAGTGLMKNGLSFDVRYSHNSGEGYIRNAKTNLNSLFATIGWLKGKSAMRINYIMGDQKSGITWEGISREQMESDRRYNPAGMYYDAAGNVHYYDNETDNYIQHHLQYHHILSINDNLSLSSTLHFTKGDGYYENYKMGRKFSSLGLPNQILEGTTYKKSDVVIQQALDNKYTAFVSNLTYNNAGIRANGGLSYSYYHGDHFGDLIWAMYNQNIEENFRWYHNFGYKSDFSLFMKGEFNLTGKIVAFADIQYRGVRFTLRGEDKDMVSLDYKMKYNFFNPKIGLTYNMNTKNQFYASMAVGRKEPGRSDIKESIKSGRADEIKDERLIDYEAGYRLNLTKLVLSANIYMMEYKDQLVPTGKLSETGYVIKENVPVSSRRGVELAAAWKPVKQLRIDANLTLSSNKIKNYTAWTDMYDNENDWNPLPQKSRFFETTDLSFSPGTTGMAMVSFFPWESASISFNGKYVGKQYYDNTSSDTRSIPSYFVIGLKATKSFKLGSSSFMDVHFYIDNILNRKYFSNAWVYMAEFSNGANPYIEEGLYPQAGINFTAKVAFRF
ncbi:MAG: TonB-dependent receptor plug domain-containing protein [Bacteroidales bacterium]|jgi:iron complex outermembrane receptor protein